MRTLERRLLLAAMLFQAACPGKSAPKKAGAPEPLAELRRLPMDFKLDLPTARIVPRKPPVPTQFPDGSYSVQGLFSRREALLGKEVTVSGVLVEVKTPKKRDCEETKCTPPHLYLADDAKAPEFRSRLLVADFEPAQVRNFSSGQRYLVTGSFVTTSTSRFSRTEGLLSFKSARTPE
jgi:hypothetical protein